MLYRVLRILITLCLISVGSGIVVMIVSMFAGWETPLSFGVAEIAYGLYGIVVCALVQAAVSLTNKIPKSLTSKIKSPRKKR